jgi:hypothetical protein
MSLPVSAVGTGDNRQRYRQQVKTFDVGRPNAFELADLDGVAGPEVLFTNVNLVAGVAQLAQATVLTARTMQAKSFDVARPNTFQVIDLDGVAGLEVLFTDMNVVAEWPRPHRRRC